MSPSSLILIQVSALVACILGGSTDYKEFNMRWPLDSELPCIHRTVSQFGPQVTPKRNDPNWKGQRTYCFFLQETPVSFVNIYQWPQWSENQLAAGFVKRLTPSIPFSREGNSIEGCSTVTDIKSQSPSWLNDKNQNEVVRRLQSHCFYKEHSVGLKKPIKMIFKVTRSTGRRGEASYFEGKTVRYVLPRDDNFIVVDRERDLDKMCTRCNAGGGFGQPGLVNATSLTSVLDKIKAGTYKSGRR